MYQTILNDASFYQLLLKLDEDLAEETRKQGCACGGRLHSARYPRKARGAPQEVDDAYSKRSSFCCDREGCRKRRTPESFRFLSRRVYVGVVVILVAALRHGATTARLRELRQAVGVSRRTVERWRRWWVEEFPRTRFWRWAVGRFAAPIEVEGLPMSLLEAFDRPRAEARLLDLLRFILPLTTMAARREN